MAQNMEKREIDERDELQADIKQAIKEWEQAERMFNHALEQEQIDFAIHSLIASEKKYSMLLQKAKRLNMKRHHFSQIQSWIERGD